MALITLHKLNLQTCMRSHPVGLHVWFSVRRSVYFNTLCVRTVKALICAVSPEPLLFAYAISTIISWAGSYNLDGTKKTEDHWSCIAHLIAEDMLKSAVTEEKTFKHSPWAGADNPLGPKFWCQQVGLITMVIFCKFTKNPFNLWLYTHLFMI